MLLIIHHAKTPIVQYMVTLHCTSDSFYLMMAVTGVTVNIEHLTMTTKWQMTNDSHVSWLLTWSSPHLELPEGVGLDPVGGVHLGHGGGQRPYRSHHAAGQSSNKWQTELHVWTDRLEKLVLTNLKFIGFCCWVWKIWGIHGMYSGEIKFISQSHFRENKINNIITNKCNSRV